MSERPVRSRAREKTRIQQANEAKILAAALEVFSREGFRAATLDQIAAEAGMSKPNLLYYFRSKEEVYRAVLDRTLDTWLEPLRGIRAEGDPIQEIRAYIQRKLEMSRDFPRESRLYANEILRGGTVIQEEMTGLLRDLVEEKAGLIRGWIREGRLAPVDPRHLIFAIWATTQHYADFDAQIRAVLGDDGEGRFRDAARFLDTLFFEGLRPR
ncbi:MAG TPA: TetR family transcriptional regulator C-terminal domain-containing protein [Paracoccaceae bacterium]|nr:TetR family transcriptional regulator C-terminal domain-containing protein [Paracoccaceae bacterium]